LQESERTPRPVATVTPQPREPEVQRQPEIRPQSPTIHDIRDFSIPLVDLINELEPYDLYNFANDPPLVDITQNSDDDDVVFVEEVAGPSNTTNEQLIPFDPDAEFRHDISQLFINL